MTLQSPINFVRYLKLLGRHYTTKEYAAAFFPLSEYSPLRPLHAKTCEEKSCGRLPSPRNFLQAISFGWIMQMCIHVHVPTCLSPGPLA